MLDVHFDLSSDGQYQKYEQYATFVLTGADFLGAIMR